MQKDCDNFQKTKDLANFEKNLMQLENRLQNFAANKCKAASIVKST